MHPLTLSVHGYNAGIHGMIGSHVIGCLIVSRIYATSTLNRPTETSRLIGPCHGSEIRLPISNIVIDRTRIAIAWCYITAALSQTTKWLQSHDA